MLPFCHVGFNKTYGISSDLQCLERASEMHTVVVWPVTSGEWDGQSIAVIRNNEPHEDL